MALERSRKCVYVFIVRVRLRLEQKLQPRAKLNASAAKKMRNFVWISKVTLRRVQKLCQRQCTIGNTFFWNAGMHSVWIHLKRTRISSQEIHSLTMLLVVYPPSHLFLSTQQWLSDRKRFLFLDRPSSGYFVYCLRCWSHCNGLGWSAAQHGFQLENK